MGSGASADAQKGSSHHSNNNIVINDQQIISLAETSSAVGERVKYFLRAPFNVLGPITEENIAVAQASWERIINDKAPNPPLRYTASKSSEKIVDSCLVWFVKKYVFLRILSVAHLVDILILICVFFL